VDVRLRPLETGDAHLLARLYASQKGFLAPFDPPRPDSFFTLEGQRLELELLERERANDRLYRFLIEADGEPAGSISVSRITRGPFQNGGLGYWVARLRQPLAGLPAGTCVGVGGCAVEGNRGGWNLYYRFLPESQGHGLATELCQAALEAARSVDAGRPVIASPAEENLASRATAERAGLRLQWRGPGGPPDGGVRLVLADRTIGTEELAALLG